MPTAMAENTTSSQRQVNHGAPIARISRIEVPSEEHEEMNKMAHGVSETLRYTHNKKISKIVTVLMQRSMWFPAKF